MADRADDMTKASGFVGIGVCSLGPFKRAWTEARASAIAAPGLAEMNVPSMWRIRLIDGTRIEVFRHAGEMREDMRSSATLDPPGSATYGYLTRWSRLPEEYRPVVGGADHSLDSLVLAIAEGLTRRGPSRRR